MVSNNFGRQTSVRSSGTLLAEVANLRRSSLFAEF
jgi:hypothetical protein